MLRGTPSQLLQVTTGNTKNADLIALFEGNLAAIEDAFTAADHVELTVDELIVHRRQGR